MEEALAAVSMTNLLWCSGELHRRIDRTGDEVTAFKYLLKGS